LEVTGIVSGSISSQNTKGRVDAKGKQLHITKIKKKYF